MPDFKLTLQDSDRAALARGREELSGQSLSRMLATFNTRMRELGDRIQRGKIAPLIFTENYHDYDGTSSDESDVDELPAPLDTAALRTCVNQSATCCVCLVSAVPARDLCSVL